MRLLVPLALSALALTAPVAALADAARAHRMVGPAHELAHLAADARAAQAEEGGTSSTDQQLAFELTAFLGVARVAAHDLSRHETTADQVERLLRQLDDQARRVEDVLRRARVTQATRDAWRQARGALAELSSLPTGGGASDAEAPRREPAPEPEPGPEAADPNAPSVEISQTRWAGTFTPDLVLSGRFAGRGLRSATLVVQASGGREVHRVEEALAQAIRDATAGQPSDARAEVPWQVRIDDDDLASGENVITVTVTDSRGRTAEAQVRLMKRVF